MASTFLSFATCCNLSSYVKLVGWAHAQEDVTEDSMPPLIEIDGRDGAGAGYANGDGQAALPEPNSLAVGVGAVAVCTVGGAEKSQVFDKFAEVSRFSSV